MEYHKLEMILHSAKGLLDVKIFGTMDPYAQISITGDEKWSKNYTTEVAVKGGCHPVWNSAMEFKFEQLHKNYTFLFDIKHKGTMFDRDIGVVEVRIAGDNVRGEKVSYPVRIYSGEVVGEISLSYKLLKLKKSNGKSKKEDNVNKVQPTKKKKDNKNKKVPQTMKKKKNMSKPSVARKVGTKAGNERDSSDEDDHVSNIEGVSLVVDSFGSVVGEEAFEPFTSAFLASFEDENDEDEDEDEEEDEDEDEDENVDEDEDEEDEDVDQDEDEEDEDEDGDDEDDYDDDDDDDDY